MEKINTLTRYTTLMDLWDDWGLMCDNPGDMISDLSAFFNIVQTKLTDTKYDYANNTQIVELFKYYIIPKAYKSVVDIEVYDEDEELDNQHDELIGKLVGWMNYTIEEYGTIAQLYKDNSTKLMEQLKSSVITTSRASDTPEVSGSWDGDDQLSSINSTSTETANDTGTVLDRLNAARKQYKDIMELWYNNFYNAFCSEVLKW